MKSPKTDVRLMLGLLLMLQSYLAQSQYFQQTYAGADLTDGELVSTADGGFLLPHSGTDGAFFKVNAQGIAEWNIQLAGVSNQSQLGERVEALPDGNFVIAGQGGTASGNNLFLAKISSAGNILWERYFPITGGVGKISLAAIPSGGFYLGNSGSAGSPSGRLIKTDADGNLLWQQTGATNSPYSIVATANGDAIFVASPYAAGFNDVVVRRVDGSGTLLWTNAYGTSTEYGSAIALAGNDEFVVAGTQTTANNANYFIVKINGNGNELWSQSIDAGGEETLQSISPTNDGGYLISGASQTTDVFQNAVRLDGQGNLLWSETYNRGFFYDAKETTNGDLAFFGSRWDLNDFELVKTNAQGGFQPIAQPASIWQRGYPGTDAVQAEVVPTPDGGFLAASWGESVAFKTDGNGTPLWDFELPDSLTVHFGGDVAVLPDGNYLLVGNANTNNPPLRQYTYAVKTDPNGNQIWFQLYQYNGAGNYGHSVAVAPDGGFFIGNPYNLLLKADANGNQLWALNAVGFSVKDLVATADGGVVFLLNDAVVGGPVMILRKYSATGSFVWEKNYNASGGAYVGRSLTPTNDGGFALTGILTDGSFNWNISSLLLQKFDASGNLQWTQTPQFPGVNVGMDLWQTQDGGYAVTGWSSLPASRYTKLWRFNQTGNLLWEKGYFMGEGLSVQELTDGGFILLTRGLRLVRTDAQGVVFQNLVTGSVVNDQNLDCQFQQGEPGLQFWSVKASSDIEIIGTTDANGQFEIAVDTGNYSVVPNLPSLTWQPCSTAAPASFASAPATVDVGQFLQRAVSQTTVDISGPVFQDLDGDCEYDPGEPLLPNVLVGVRSEDGSTDTTAFTDNNGYYHFTVSAGEYYAVFIPAFNPNPYCTPCCTDFCNFNYLDGTAPVSYNLGMTCNIPSSVSLTGFVFYDENENCQPDFGEQGLPDGWSVQIVQAGTQDTFLVEPLTAGSAGNFSAQVETGSYYLTVIPPNYLYIPCLPVQLVNIGPGGAPTVYFALMPLAQCPKLRVDVGASFLSPCFPATYFVQYCNDGTAPADDAYVEITFPPAITVDSSEIPGVQLPGNVWQFQLGDVPKDSCGNFEINAFLNCADSVGWTYCVEAHIFPDSICGPGNATWDGSSVELSADCIGDSVVLTISNAGWGSMSQPLNFIVVEDNVLIRDSTFQLPAGGSTQVTVFPNGATIILSAQQAAGHPGMSMPLVFVEGCGADSISLGFVTQYPQDDADCFLAIDCRESVAACDPNTKEAQPKGVTEAHYIENTTELTYQITFQNLGTAAAQNVVILDTLSQYLDTSRLQLGVSSHHYEFELLPQNVLKFTFPNIQLPHADLDYDASIGFVKYRIPQRPGNLPGTEIHTWAGIYFDFNAPVITNTVTHRIPAPQYVQNQQVLLCAGDVWNGQPILADTAISVVTHYAFFDSIQNTVLDVLPSVMVEVDTTVAVGSVVYGVVVNADTSFTQMEMTPIRCIERNVNVHVLTDATPGLENLRQFAIAPNPAFGQLTLSGQLTTGAFCEAKLLDAYGRTVAQCFENEWIAGSFSRRVDLRDVPPGLYFVSFAMDGERKVTKVVVE
jgi:hypothetical protein